MKKRIYYQSAMMVLLLLLLVSCASIKTIPYLQNSSEVDLSNSAYLYDLHIRPQDELRIIVSSTPSEAAEMFNIRDPRPLEPARGTYRLSGGNGQLHSYLVDVQGNVDFPMVGTSHLAGLTIEEAAKEVKEKIAPYIQKDVDYSVNVYLSNYYVSVLGEVNSPNSFDVPSYKINVLEALAMAGDLTIYGLRENVKLLRQLDDGTYEIHQLDLTDANLLSSPYYYMQQRDVLYVEPNPVRAQDSKISRTTMLWFRGASIVISLGALSYRAFD